MAWDQYFKTFWLKLTNLAMGQSKIVFSELGQLTPFTFSNCQDKLINLVDRIAGFENGFKGLIPDLNNASVRSQDVLLLR